VSALDAECFDVGAESFGDAEPVDRQHGHESVLAGRRQACGDEQRTDLVAVQTCGVGLVAQAGPPDMRGR
jgi:hypothetical protein